MLPSAAIPCANPPERCGNGDNINWGQLYLANDGDIVVVGPGKGLRAHFVSTGKLGGSGTFPMTGSPGAAGSDDFMPVIATTLDLNNQNDPGEPLSVVVAYDQDVAIRWWGTDFKGLWTQESASAVEM